MAFRGSEETLRARILELEEENAKLRAEIARLSGATPLTDPGPAPVAVDRAMWWPGESWIMGWDPPNARLAHTGEVNDSQYLRFLGLSDPKSTTSFELAKNGAKHTVRFLPGIVAPLADQSLAFFAWPGNAITSSRCETMALAALDSARSFLLSKLMLIPWPEDSLLELAVTSKRPRSCWR